MGLAETLIHTDNIIATVSTLSGVLYTILAGKGWLFCYLFGMASSVLYGYLSYKNGLYGNSLLNWGYYFPIYIVGFFQWKKHLKPKTCIIKKTKLSSKERTIVFLLTTLLFFILALGLKFFGDSSPFYDSFTTVFSIAGMYLTVKRAIEQWFIWMGVNFIAVLMWCKAIYNGSHAYSTVIMWVIYFIHAIYFYIEWRKELHMTDDRVN